MNIRDDKKEVIKGSFSRSPSLCPSCVCKGNALIQVLPLPERCIPAGLAPVKLHNLLMMIVISMVHPPL